MRLDYTILGLALFISTILGEYNNWLIETIGLLGGTALMIKGNNRVENGDSAEV